MPTWSTTRPPPSAERSPTTPSRSTSHESSTSRSPRERNVAPPPSRTSLFRTAPSARQLTGTRSTKRTVADWRPPTTTTSARSDSPSPVARSKPSTKPSGTGRSATNSSTSSRCRRSARLATAPPSPPGVNRWRRPNTVPRSTSVATTFAAGSVGRPVTTAVAGANSPESPVRAWPTSAAGSHPRSAAGLTTNSLILEKVATEWGELVPSKPATAGGLRDRAE